MQDKKILTSCTERIVNIYRKNKNKENDFTLLLVSFAGLLSVLDENIRKLQQSEALIAATKAPKKRWWKKY